MKNLIFLETLILQTKEKTDSSTGVGLTRQWKKDLHKNPSKREGLQTLTSLLRDRKNDSQEGKWELPRLTIPYRKEHDGTQRKKNKRTHSEPKSQPQNDFPKKTSDMNEQITQKDVFPYPKVFLEIHLSSLPHHTPNPQKKIKELFRDIFLQIPVSAFNVLIQPLKRVRTMFTSNSPTP